MASSDLRRVEFGMRADDYALLQRIAQGRHTTVSEIVRGCVYAGLEPLKRAVAERDEIARRRLDEERKMADWTGTKRQSSDYDPAAPERYAPWLEE